MSQRSEGRLNTRIEQRKYKQNDAVSLQFLSLEPWSSKWNWKWQKTIHLFATKENRNNHNTKKLAEQNKPTTPVAVIKAIIQGSCGYKLSNHYDEDRIPQSTMFCVGCRVSLVEVSIKPEWGLYHGSIGTVLDIVYEHKEGPHYRGSEKKINQCMSW